MSWFPSSRPTSPVTPSTASRRRFFASAGAVAGSALLARTASATGADLGIEPGTLVDAQGKRLDRAPMASEPFLGEIMIVSFPFAPRGWAFCHGQLLPVSEHEALFALIGTIYGGDGQTTFALPDLRGRVPLSQGQGPGLSSYTLGERSGAESVTLTAAQVPQHAHALPEVQVRGTGTQAVGATAGGDRGTETTSTVGGSQPHPNMPPYLALHYVIALQGIFPSPN